MTPSSSRATLLVAGLIAALGLGIGVGAASYAVFEDDEPATVAVDTTDTAATTETQPTASAGDEGISVAEIYERTNDSVVEITTSSGGSGAQGSGFVFDTEGHVVTNQHVVAGASDINVRFSNGSTYPASLVGSDRSTDLAVIDVDAPAAVLQPLELGDSSAVRVGDAVVALGSPFGLEGTITSGIVSALHRQMTAPNNFTITDSIQTDAAINHGNSGGPLLDSGARVVGVNSQIESETGGNVGIGFAVPSNTVRSVVEDIVEDGDVEHAFLGVGIQTIPAEVAEELGGAAGVGITNVRDGSPAAEADLRAGTGSRTVDGVSYPTGGDVITAVDGDAVGTSEQLQSLVAEHAPGDELELTVVHDGERRTVTVTLADRPD